MLSVANECSKQLPQTELVRPLEPAHQRGELRGLMASTVVNLRKPVSGRRRLGLAPEAPKPRNIEVPKDGGLLPVWIHERVTKASRNIKARVPLTELLVFTRQLGRMVAAGLTLHWALGVLAGQTRDGAMAAVIQDVRRRIEGGASFSAAIAARPKVFSKLYVAMVTSGERAGLLPEVLARLARMLESTARLRRKVKSA